MNRRVITSGKRKAAVARAVITEGNGNVKINGKDYNSLEFLDKLRIEEPIRICKEILNKADFDVEIGIQGGGAKGQIEAARLALARAISQFENSKEITEAFTAYDRSLLVADVRRKEARKPGDSKARAKRQSSKR